MIPLFFRRGFFIRLEEYNDVFADIFDNLLFEGRQVLHCGSEEWNRPLHLHDMLDIPKELEEVVKPYISDYSINLIDVAHLPKEARQRLTSDFRLIADYLACKNDPEEMRNFMKTKDYNIRHPDEFLDMLSEVTG